MCQATDAVRAVLGIRPYTPGPIPHARVRKPTRFGARGNGHTAGPIGLEIPAGRLIDTLAREHRIIRQLLGDAARRCVRGPG